MTAASVQTWLPRSRINHKPKRLQKYAGVDFLISTFNPF